MASKAEIKSIKIVIGDAETDLTIEEARNLKSALDEIFPDPVRDRIFPMPQPYPYLVPIWPRQRPDWDRWVTWGNTGGGAEVRGRYESTTGTLALQVRG